MANKSTVAGASPRQDQRHALPTHQPIPLRHTLHMVIHDHRLLPFNDVAADERAMPLLHQIPLPLHVRTRDAWPLKERMKLDDLHLDSLDPTSATPSRSFQTVITSARVKIAGNSFRPSVVRRRPPIDLAIERKARCHFSAEFSLRFQCFQTRLVRSSTRCVVSRLPLNEGLGEIYREVTVSPTVDSIQVPPDNINSYHFICL